MDDADPIPPLTRNYFCSNSLDLERFDNCWLKLESISHSYSISEKCSKQLLSHTHLSLCSTYLMQNVSPESRNQSKLLRTQCSRALKPRAYCAGGVVGFRAGSFASGLLAFDVHFIYFHCCGQLSSRVTVLSLTCLSA